MFRKVSGYFFKLGFNPSWHDDFHLGPLSFKVKLYRILWELLVYFLLACGILCREILVLEPKLGMDPSGIDWGTAIAAFVVATIPFPVIIRRLTKRKAEGGLSLIFIPFAYGLTIDIATTLTLSVYQYLK